MQWIRLLLTNKQHSRCYNEGVKRGPTDPVGKAWLQSTDEKIQGLDPEEGWDKSH